MTRKEGSLFTGIGGWPLACRKVGIESIWSSEIEPFPIQITKKHFPDMKHLGDLTKIDGAKIEPVDVITFGSPCQDLSIAGRREGLEGERSGLFKHAIRIIREMRAATNNRYPRFAVWENVPGAFSSNKGADFRTVLKEITTSEIPIPRSNKWATAGMVRSGECEVAWRVLDAQYWGVPQRRKRIFLVADFRGQCAGEILFKPESVSRYFTESKSERKGTTRNIENCARTAGFCPEQSAKTRSVGYAEEQSPTLRAGATPAIALRMRGGCEGGGKGALISKEKSLTLATGNGQTVFKAIPFGEADLHNYKEGRVSTLKASGGCLGGGSETFIKQGYLVRKLIPLECERLQGLVDNWTAGGSDTARYKALGNGMAQPCADYVMQNIAEVFRRGELEYILS